MGMLDIVGFKRTQERQLQKSPSAHFAREKFLKGEVASRHAFSLATSTDCQRNIVAWGIYERGQICLLEY
ncbi:hypothetical protein NL676_005284 [Syzygium grande]|nr:hypothetical protein NL676_005284 [Syzygium grande]